MILRTAARLLNDRALAIDFVKSSDGGSARDQQVPNCMSCEVGSPWEQRACGQVGSRDRGSMAQQNTDRHQVALRLLAGRQGAAHNEGRINEYAKHEVSGQVSSPQSPDADADTHYERPTNPSPLRWYRCRFFRDNAAAIQRVQATAPASGSSGGSRLDRGFFTTRCGGRSPPSATILALARRSRLL